MKKYIIYIVFEIAAVISFTACNNKEIVAPGFDVAPNKLTFKVGDTIVFNISGNPDMILFYSGENGKRYANANRLSASGAEKLVFQSSMQQGVIPSNDSLRLMVSSNLSGYDAASVQKATWTDITSRNTKWPTALSTNFTTSDSVDISDFNTANKINIAFKYIGKKNPAAAQRKWQIQNLALSNNLSDGTVTPLFAAPFLGPATPSVSAFAYTGWVEVSIKNNTQPGTASNGYAGYNAWNVGTGGISTADSVRNSNGIPIRAAYPITFDPGPTVNNDDNEDWLITTSVDLKTTKADAGTPIKKLADVPLSLYKYIVKKAGVYTMTFVATNSDVSDQRSVIKQVTITVTP